jgi:[ribosomal protein S5]-alanine N-acetyltransferase
VKQNRSRVYLRVPSASDAKELIALNRASTGLHQGLVSPPNNKEKFRAFLKRCESPGYCSFLICRREDDAIVGAISVNEIVRGLFQSGYLGYYVGETFARQRYMTEALALMLHHSFNQLKLHRVEANIQPGNTASIALVRRAGFDLEGYSRRYLKIAGRWRDHERWTLLAEDWKANRRRFDNANRNRK